MTPATTNGHAPEIVEIVIDLTPEEVELAAMVATKRHVQNVFRGAQHKYGASNEESWTMHIEGAAGELAVAKWRNVFWNGNLGDYKADDVGRLQVRTRSRHDYELILHPEDPDDRAFILVTGLAPHFVLRGWCWGREGKRKEWWKDPAGNRPAYFVPQAALRPLPSVNMRGVA